MKPRAFIGSSVEGLTVAYSVQQNLLHDVEATVWDQGIFELSSTTIESLLKALAETDFAIFVFSPDDVLKMRGHESQSVRDNVLFEAGLFIGRLGRARVFFIVPSVGDFHIPSDLLGVTPGKYDTSRSDGSMQAATGPVCHQIRLQIKKLGPLSTASAVPGTPEEVKKDSDETRWIIDVFEKRYELAREKLQKKIANLTDEEALATSAWLEYVDFLQSGSTNPKPLLDYAAKHPKSAEVQVSVAAILRLESYPEEAITLLNATDPSIRDFPKIREALLLSYEDTGEVSKATELFQKLTGSPDPEIAVTYARILQGNDRKQEALEVLQRCYLAEPQAVTVRYAYARLAQDLDKPSLALYLLHGLAIEFPKNSEYWGYLANACYSLGLFDKALSFYRRAEEAAPSESAASWIVSNIGNLYLAKDLTTDAIETLTRASKSDPESQYCHRRLAEALEKRDEDTKEFNNYLKEGRLMAREAQAQPLAAT